MTVDEFIQKMKPRASQELIDVSYTGKLSTRTWKLPNGDVEITVIRGGAIEKAAIMYMVRKGIIRPGIAGKVDSFVYQMEIFPENPHCPMGHFNTEGVPGYFYNMNLDLFPAVQIEEDLKAMRAGMDKVADRFGRDRDKMREGLDKHYNMEHFTTPLATKVGCKLLELKNVELNLFTSAYETFFDVYLDIIRKRKDTPYNKNDLQLKLERNGKWLEYMMLKDGAIKQTLERGIIPLEVLIEFGFPPSAAF